ncbi:32502_t:CDS:2, partial [Racocetra persica]
RDESQTHFHLFEMLCDDIDILLCNDSLINDIVDLGSSQFSLNEEEQNVLMGERSSIKGLSKDALVRQLPLEYDVNVVRGEKQSIASKNQKVLEE